MKRRSKYRFKRIITLDYFDFDEWVQVLRRKSSLICEVFDHFPCFIQLFIVFLHRNWKNEQLAWRYCFQNGLRSSLVSMLMQKSHWSVGAIYWPMPSRRVMQTWKPISLPLTLWATTAMYLTSKATTIGQSCWWCSLPGRWPLGLSERMVSMTRLRILKTYRLWW